MNNPPNIYYGQGIGVFDENKIVSIFNNDLRCGSGGGSDGLTSLYYTTEILGFGNQIEGDRINMLKNWPHYNSRQIVIVFLQNRYIIFDSVASNTKRMTNSVYYYISDGNKNNNGTIVLNLQIIQQDLIDNYYKNKINVIR